MVVDRLQSPGICAMRNRKRVQESSWSLEGGLVLVTDGAGYNEFLDVPVQVFPPESAPEKVLGPLDPRVAGETLWPHWSTLDRNKEWVR